MRDKVIQLNVLSELRSHHRLFPLEEVEEMPPHTMGRRGERGDEERRRDDRKREERGGGVG
jgi:hypothetical protein